MARQWYEYLKQDNSNKIPDSMRFFKDFFLVEKPEDVPFDEHYVVMFYVRQSKYNSGSNYMYDHTESWTETYHLITYNEGEWESAIKNYYQSFDENIVNPKINIVFFKVEKRFNIKIEKNYSVI